MTRTTIHPSLEGMPFRVGFECAIDYDGNTLDAEVTSIDQVTGVVGVALRNGNRRFFKYSKRRRAWMCCELNARGRWVFYLTDTQLIW